MIDVRAIPKAELHVHIEGTFEPAQIFEFAARNGVTLPYAGVKALQDAYQFTDLQSFLNLYYAAMAALRTERDFEELTTAYLQRAQAQGVKHAEIFFDPQAHLARGIAFETVLDGLWAALARSEVDFDITTGLIMCFLRDQPADSAMQTLELAIPHRDRIIGVGLDSAELGNPPSKFQGVFDRARAEKFLTVAHAGEEGPPEYIWQALDLLKVSRVDHGVRCMEDAALVDRLARSRIPLTVCPLSNLRLRVVASLQDHPLKRMLHAGLLATCNSDDPAYFGGYVADNFAAVRSALAMSDDELITLARNSFEASFIDDETKRRYVAQVDEMVTAAP
ncbi:MAG TPA: adenosine deaminase [Candidatus Rubrimentiphilum sp.]|nr:adenosine deaminase [Candidatus Rubrimentiphilum sp.]